MMILSTGLLRTRPRNPHLQYTKYTVFIPHHTLAMEGSQIRHPSASGLYPYLPSLPHQGVLKESLLLHGLTISVHDLVNLLLLPP